jgi:hypothetical protein
MAASKKLNTQKNIKTKYVAAIRIILIGILFQLFEIGGNNFAGFPSLGMWIIFTGVITTAIISMNFFQKKKKL